MDNQVQEIRNTSVKEMGSHELLGFFEGYIPLLIERQKLNEYIAAQRKTIQQKKRLRLNKIETRYHEEFNEHFVKEREIKEKKIKTIERRIFNGKPIKFFKTIFLMWLLTFVLFPELNGGDKFFMAIGIAIPVYLFRNVIKTLLKFIFNQIKKTYLNYIDKKCVRQAKQKGITKENLKQQGGYELMITEATDKYATLETTLIAPSRSKIRTIDRNLQTFIQKLPMVRGFSNIAELMVMYHAVQSGRADNWKESLNVLSVEIKHREIITNMESLHSTSQTIAKEVRYMSKKIDAINQEIAYSRQTMSSELRRLEQSLEESNYRTVDVYHHKSN